jgi:hypothetical protein
MPCKNKPDFRQVGYELGTKARLGRPLKGDEPLTENVTFRLTAREAQCLKDWAFRYDQQPSDVLRWALSVLSITGM